MNKFLDYLKSMSKKEFFYIDLFDALMGFVVLVIGVVSVITGPTVLTYALMFGGGTLILFCNCYKSFKQGSKAMGAVYLLAGIAVGTIAVMSIMTLIIKARG